MTKGCNYFLYDYYNDMRNTSLLLVFLHIGPIKNYYMTPQFRPVLRIYTWHVI